MKTYTIMIKGLFSEGLTSEVNKLLKVMEENRCSPNDFTYNTIIRGFIGNSEMQGQFKFFMKWWRGVSLLMHQLQSC